MSDNEVTPDATEHQPSGIIQPEITPIGASTSHASMHQIPPVSDPNPYQYSFGERLVLEELELQQAQASAGKRLGGYLLDLLFAGVFLVILIILVGICSALFNLNNRELSDFVYGLIGLAAICSPLVYYTLFEYVTGGYTMGKLITKTRVVTRKGKKPSFWHCVGRSFGRVIPFDWLGIFVTDGRCFHDLISSTYVVEANAEFLKK